MEEQEYLVTLDDGETDFITAYSIGEAWVLSEVDFGGRVYHVELNSL